MNQAVIAAIILAITIILFAVELFPPAITAVLSALAMCICGIISAEEVAAGFSNDVFLFCFGISVVGAALSETGCTAYIGQKLVSALHLSERGIVVVLILLAAAFSMFLSNTSVVVIFMSIAGAMADSTHGKISRKNTYMAIGLATVAGGGCTLIGSTTQLAIKAILPTYNIGDLGMFTLFGPGILVPVLLAFYMYFYGYRRQTTVFDFEEPVNLQPQKGSAVSVPQQHGFRFWAPLGVLACSIALTIIGWQSIAVIGLLGAMLVVIFGCISPKRMWQTADWNTLFVIAGGVGFAAGMENSGACDLLAKACIQFMGNDAPALLYLAVFVMIATVMTNIMPNVSTALILVPIAISVAQNLGFQPLPFVIGCIWGANMPYSTPIGASVITMTMQAGYRFKDYVKIGLPFNLLACIVVIIMTSICYPLI